MAKQRTKKKSRGKSVASELHEGITQVSVCGYKSIARPTSIEIRPLTVLCGANSSGKSSIMQPLLLLKQTLDASFDPGPLLLDGPNIKFAFAEQLFSRVGSAEQADRLHIEIAIQPATVLAIRFRKNGGKELAIEWMRYTEPGEDVSLRPGMTHAEITKILPPYLKDFARTVSDRDKGKVEWRIQRRRCFLAARLQTKGGREAHPNSYLVEPTGEVQHHIRGIIHLPGLRGNPRRSYPVTALGPAFPGTFETYTASLVFQ